MRRKALEWEGDSLETIRSFPEDAKRMFGFHLDRIQQGKPSPIAKHWDGPVWELRDASSSGKSYRVAYVAVIEGEVTVLHCFEKRSQKTSRIDKERIVKRLKDVQERKRKTRSQKKTDNRSGDDNEQ